MATHWIEEVNVNNKGIEEHQTVPHALLIVLFLHLKCIQEND